MDEPFLDCLLAELRPLLVAARIEKAYQYGDSDLALRLRAGGERATLVLSAEPLSPALALIGAEPPEPRERSPLLEAVRARAVPARIADVDKPPGERLVVLGLAGPGGAGCRLVFELVPRAPALLLLGPDGRILAAAGCGLPGKRGLAPGRSWTPPVLAPPADPGPLAGLSRQWAREVEARATALGTSLEQARRSLAEEVRLRPDPGLHVLAGGRLVPTPVPFLSLAGRREPFPSLRALAEAWYLRGVAGHRQAELRARLVAAIERRRARTRRTLERVGGESALAASAESDRRCGELLLAFQVTAEPAPGGVRVPDPERDGAWLEVPLLEPRRTLVGNANLYFDRYRNKKRAAERIAARLLALERDLAHLDDLEAAVAAAEPGELPALGEELAAERLLAAGAAPRPPRGGRAPRRPATPAALEPRRFRTGNGPEILVGRSSRGNDRLTFRLAARDDFWLHADAPGSHVVLRNPAHGSEPDGEALVAAAALAAWYSKLRGSAKAEVKWTRVSEVRKVAGGPPGLVTLRSHRSIAVDPALAARRFGLACGEVAP